jgi:hypothetical protein
MFRELSAIRRIDRSIESWLQIIMLQPEILLRCRNPRIADDHPPPAGRQSKETRRSGLFQMKSLNDRHGKQNGRWFTALWTRFYLIAGTGRDDADRRWLIDGVEHTVVRHAWELLCYVVGRPSGWGFREWTAFPTRCFGLRGDGRGRRNWLTLCPKSWGG